jgi:hypothetical protein
MSLASVLTNSFVALVEDRLNPLRGTLARGFLGTISGIVMDMIAERYRLGIRAQLAVDDTTTPSHHTHLRRRYGLPTYPLLDVENPADYASEIARMRATTDTHPLAGSTERLTDEVSYGTGVSLGSVVVRSLDDDAGWIEIESIEYADPEDYDTSDAEYDDGSTYDVGLTDAQSRAIAAIVAYYFQAGSKLRSMVK